MAWTTPLTAVATAGLTAAQWNASVRDNLNETAPAKATTSGQFFVSTAANSLAARTPAVGAVNTSDTTTSTSYTSTLTGGTVGPAATVTTGGTAIVAISTKLTNAVGGGSETMASYAVSGATTDASDDRRAVYWQPDTATRAIRASAVLMHVGLNPGSNTFTMQYRVGGNTGTFAQRQITVIPF